MKPGLRGSGSRCMKAAYSSPSLRERTDWSSVAAGEGRREVGRERPSPLVRAGDRALFARQEIVDPLPLLLEGDKLRATKFAPARHADFERVDETAVDQNLEVEVRTGREA